VRFCRWYPLADAAGHAPAAPGVLQVRVAEGLIDYPAGRSAMVHYEHATDVRDRALALAAAYPGRALWCRHLDPEGETVDLEAFHARVLGEFVRRFGTAPSFESAP
jgi:hypothetical protein